MCLAPRQTPLRRAPHHPVDGATGAADYRSRGWGAHNANRSTSPQPLPLRVPGPLPCYATIPHRPSSTTTAIQESGRTGLCLSWFNRLSCPLDPGKSYVFTVVANENGKGKRAFSGHRKHKRPVFPDTSTGYHQQPATSPSDYPGCAPNSGVQGSEYLIFRMAQSWRYAPRWSAYRRRQ